MEAWLGVVRCRNQAARPAHASHSRTRARARGARCVLVALAGAAIAAVGQALANASVWSSFVVTSPGPACWGAATAATRPRLWLRSPQGVRGSSATLAARGGAEEEEEDDEYEYVPQISVRTLKVGQELAGVVTKVTFGGAFVDFGAEQAGFVPLSKLQDGITARAQDVVKMGDSVIVWVSEVKDQVILSMSKLKVGRNFGTSNVDFSVFQGVDPDTWVEGRVAKLLPNVGCLVEIPTPSGDATATGLVPMGQIKDGERIEDISKEVAVDQKVKVRVLSVDVATQRLSLSMKPPLAGVKPFEGISPDVWMEGKVIKVLPVGCLVEISAPSGGATATGLVPISQIKDGERVDDVSKEVTVDQKVKVRIVSVDVAAQRLSLSMRAPIAGVKPFEGISPDVWMEGKVVKVLPGVGCLVEIPAPAGGATATGLVPIGQIKDGERVEDVSKEVTEGQQVKVRVQSVDVVAQRLTLSMRPPFAGGAGGGGLRPGGPAGKDVRPFEGISPDVWMEGKVVNVLAGVGCFVEVPTPAGDATATGLVPMSQIRDGGGPIEDLKSEVTVGQQVKVRVQSVDVDKQRLALSMRAPQLAGGAGGGGRLGGPATKNVKPFEGADPDSWVEGKVVKLLPNVGCLVEIPTPAGDGTATGLVPISQIKDGERVEDVSAAVTEGQQVKVRVQSVDLAAQRLTLSMRQPFAGGAGGGRARAGGPATQDVTPFEGTSPDVWLEGKVTKILAVGCLVELPTPTGATVTGIVPLGQIREGPRLDAINGEVTVGEQVKVRIQSVDVANQKLSLSMRPPATGAASLKVFEGADSNAWVDGKVVKLLNTGCLVEIPTPTGDGTATGLVLNAEIREGVVEDAGEEVVVGQEVKVRITKVDAGANKLSLSMREPGGR